MSPEQIPSRSFGRRSFLRASGTVAAAGFLAACAGNTGRGGAAGGKAISQWYHQYGEAGTQQAALRYAKAYSKANVSVQWIPGDYASKLSSGLVSSNGPDVFEFHPDVQMAKSGQIVPLDDIIADVKSDFTEKDLAANSVDGKVYGIRMIDDPQFLYYRKSLLEKAGVEPPTTFDELIEASRKLDKGGVKGLYLGLKGGSDILAGPLVWATGSELLTADHKVAFDNPDDGRGPEEDARAVQEQDAAARRAHRLVGPVGVHPGPDRDAVVRHVGDARHPEGTRRRLRHRPPARPSAAPAARRSTTAAGRRSSAPRPRTSTRPRRS